MPSYTISNTPENLSMRDTLAYSSAYGGLVKSARYAIRIQPVGSLLLGLGYADFIKQFTYLSDSAEMPGRAFMSIDGRYYGPNFKVPIQSQYEDTTITFLCRTESFERQFFDDWMEIINPSNLWDFNYRDSYRSNIEIFQLAEAPENEGDTAPKAVYKWSLWDAFPVILNPQPVTWADDNVQRLSVSFTYSHWTRVGRDTTPGTFATPDKFVRGSTSRGLPGLPDATAPLPPGSQSGSTGGGSVGGPGSGGGGGGGGF